MSVTSGQVITKEFRTRSFSSGELTDADALPVGTLYANGVASAAVVTITRQSTGRYDASVTLPSLADGTVVDLEVAATVGGVSDAEIVWTDTIDPAVDSTAPAPFDDSVLAANAAGPWEVETDAGRVRQHRLTEQIEADRYLASKAAGTDPRRAVRFNRVNRRDPT